MRGVQFVPHQERVSLLDDVRTSSSLFNFGNK